MTGYPVFCDYCQAQAIEDHTDSLSWGGWRLHQTAYAQSWAMAETDEAQQEMAREARSILMEARELVGLLERLLSGYHPQVPAIPKRWIIVDNRGRPWRDEMDALQTFANRATATSIAYAAFDAGDIEAGWKVEEYGD